jgi:phosphatidylglycerophosphatase A
MVVDIVNIHRHSPSGAMWRSLLFPGWGQLYNRRYIKAGIIGGMELGFMWGIYNQHQRLEKARREDDKESANFYRNDRNRLSWWLAGIILYSMADAYVDGQLWDYDLSDEISLTITPEGLLVRW